MRSRAIACALWYGLTPWPLYESEPHAGRGVQAYIHHAALNLALAARWVTGRETPDDIEFEVWNNG